MSKNSYKKGKSYELKVARVICNHFGVDQKTHLVKTKLGFQPELDLVPTDKFKETFPFHVSCKKVESWTYSELFNQKNNAILRWFKEGEDLELDPFILVFSRNFQPDFVACYLKYIVPTCYVSYLLIKTILKIAPPITTGTLDHSLIIGNIDRDNSVVVLTLSDFITSFTF